jgi:hypothetical protein
MTGETVTCVTESNRSRSITCEMSPTGEENRLSDWSSEIVPQIVP